MLPSWDVALIRVTKGLGKNLVIYKFIMKFPATIADDNLLLEILFN